LQRRKNEVNTNPRGYPGIHNQGKILQ